MMTSVFRNSFIKPRLGAGLWAALILTAGLTWAAGQVMSVQVRSTKMRSRPSFLGSTVSEMTYGTQVKMVSQQGPWIQVTGPQGKTGWLHESALSEKDLAMVSGGTEAATGASGEEIALAGKGFNAQVENEFLKQNPDLDFKLVDRMEKVVITPEQAAAFLAAGQVEPTEGGR